MGSVEVLTLLDGVRDIETSIVEAFEDAPAEGILAYRERHPGIYGDGGAWRLFVRAWLLRHPRGTLLVDTGIGTTVSPAWFGADGALLAVLSSAGVSPGEIDTVAISHVHDDHIGGTVDHDGKPIFESARHLVQRADWEWQRRKAAEDEAGEEDRPIWETLLVPLEEAGLVEIVDGDVELTDLVRLRLLPGHTPGHQVVEVRSEGSRFIVTADAFNHPAQLEHPEWPSGPDNDHALAETSRRRLVEDLATEPGTVIGPTHFADAFGRVARDAAGELAWEPVPGE